MSDLPKEQQTAYQRWEMTSFGDERPSAVAAREAAERVRAQAARAAATPVAPPPAWPTEAELAALREQARADGHAEGLAAGRAEGRAEALALGQAETGRALAQLRDVAEAFGAALADADQRVANAVLELALQLAQAMLKAALPARPELILPLVREAIAALPALQLPAQLMLHPDDAAAVRAGLGDELTQDGWRVVDDPHIGRGGCRISTASNEVDAEAGARWQRLCHALGADLAWLAP